jgi:hypothetical protein
MRRDRRRAEIFATFRNLQDAPAPCAAAGRNDRRGRGRFDAIGNTAGCHLHAAVAVTA